MQRRTYRGESLTARGLAQALITRFNVGQIMAQAQGPDDHIIVQIASRERDRGGQVRAALTISIIQVDNAVEVSLGEQQWLGPAADILQAGFPTRCGRPSTIMLRASVRSWDWPKRRRWSPARSAGSATRSAWGSARPAAAAWRPSSRRPARSAASSRRRARRSACAVEPSLIS
jgi:hypothetical protein